MKNAFATWNRRTFLAGGGFASLIAAGFRPRYVQAAQLAAQHGEIYRQLGVRPLINAAGTYTVLSGSLLPERARRAMEEASRCFVHLVDLQRAVGERIAKMLDVESAMVTSGAACSIMLATAACATGTDPEKIRRIPDLTGMKSEVIVPREHRNGFDHAARNVGVKLVEVETITDLHHAIGPKTLMLYFTNIFEYKGQIKRKEFIAAGRQAGIPVFNDAAAELPPATNLASIVQEGFDLVGFSGGKGLRGPQSSGLLLGRKDLIQAALLNNNPNEDAIGRPSKVGKEEMMGPAGGGRGLRATRSRRRPAPMARFGGEHRQGPAAHFHGLGRGLRARPRRAPDSISSRAMGPEPAEPQIRRLCPAVARRRALDRGQRGRGWPLARFL